ncbi:MAG: precorrin-8X methylmutase [Deltaproteobacteria bacterium]|nr:precorrin-8X methylmutase [Candidatus Tharpella sp.]
MSKSLKTLLADIEWQMSGMEIENESFRRIEKGLESFQETVDPEIYRIGRRLVHTTADFTIVNDLSWNYNPVAAGLEALRDKVPIYCDSSMIRSGISLSRLQLVNNAYSPEDVHCLVADSQVVSEAGERGQARSLVAVEKAKDIINGGIVLIGNAPLALAGIIRLLVEENIRPRLIIGMPVGFVHVIESKNLVIATDIPQVVIKGRRGGSSLAVATLHAIIESLV